MATETRPVEHFDRIVIRDYGDLLITQGSEESLTIEADQDILPKIKAQVVDHKLSIRIAGSWANKIGEALRAGLAGRWIKYRVTVKELRGLEVVGALSATAREIQTDRLTLRLGGAGAITVRELTAEELLVDLPGAGAITIVGGKVTEQRVAVGGAGSYHAAKLESQRADVNMKGAGAAVLWATEELKATVSGVGSISYYGDPQVSQKVTGVGNISRKTKP
jgi:hypothetical protein